MAEDFEVHPIGTAQRLRAMEGVSEGSALTSVKPTVTAHRSRQMHIGNKEVLTPVKPTVTSIDWRERALAAEGRLDVLRSLLDAYREGDEDFPTYAQLAEIAQVSATAGR